MLNKKPVAWIWIPMLLVPADAAAAQGEASEPSKPPAELAGFWRRESGKTSTTLLFAAARCAWRTGDEFHAHLTRFAPGRVVLNYDGVGITWRVEVEDGELRIRSGKGAARVYQRVAASSVQDFEPAPMRLGKSKRLKKRERKAIQKELAKRARKDQLARNSSKDEKKIAAIDKSNTTYLGKVIRKTGWIDVKRFGETTADNAWPLIIHCGDLPMMLAALAAIESESKSMRLQGGQNYATLYDRVQSYLGRRQRYGTQVCTDAQGKFVVFPLEDVDNIDTVRKKIGLPSFDQSLQTQARWTGEKPKVQTDW